MRCKCQRGRLHGADTKSRSALSPPNALHVHSILAVMARTDVRRVGLCPAHVVPAVSPRLSRRAGDTPCERSTLFPAITARCSEACSLIIAIEGGRQTFMATCGRGGATVLVGREIFVLTPFVCAYRPEGCISNNRATAASKSCGRTDFCI